MSDEKPIEKPIEKPDSATEGKLARLKKAKAPSDGPNPLTKLVGVVRRVPAGVVGLVRAVSEEYYERPRRAVKILGCVTLGLAIVTGLLGYQALQYSRTAQARDDAVLVAKDSLTQLLSYNFRTIDQQVASTQDLLTGRFKDDYANLVRGTIVNTAKQSQVEIQTEVVNESVVYSKPSQVVLLVYINQQSGTKNTGEDPILSGSRLRVALRKDDGKWRISELTPV